MGGMEDFMFDCASVLGCKATEMAQVKAAGGTPRSHQDFAELYSDMATVSSSAGWSKKQSNVLKTTDLTLNGKVLVHCDNICTGVWKITLLFLCIQLNYSINCW
ncbi:hypothetical protein XENOCAPTIV_017060 [Xenoophorus captivus]|uniref:Uncharacterized protein n=1 Tax=Xenoophorus captivus TaxID=1517983 RepID=A0ABV0SCL6_9TELE